MRWRGVETSCDSRLREARSLQASTKLRPVSMYTNVHGTTVLTSPDVVIHDEDVVDYLGEPANIAHRITVRIRKRPDLRRGRD